VTGGIDRRQTAAAPPPVRVRRRIVPFGTWIRRFVATRWRTDASARRLRRMNSTFTPAIVIHLAAAAAAVLLGAFVFFTRKGSARHRLLGRAWVALMLLTAASTWWIRSSGSFSVIHLLSVATVAALALAVWLAATGRVRRHRNAMLAIYGIALVTAGLFTLLPQRLLGHMLWTSLGLI
jgi:uncharacterized membrane protein